MDWLLRPPQLGGSSVYYKLVMYVFLSAQNCFSPRDDGRLISLSIFLLSLVANDDARER